MKVQEFEALIRQAGLNHISTGFGPTFLVSLHERTEHGLRVQCHMLAYQPGELAMMPPEVAQRHIEACKAEMSQAAKTQQGRLASEATKQKRQIVQHPTVTRTSVNYPAH